MNIPPAAVAAVSGSMNDDESLAAAMAEDIRLVAHDPAWPQAFEAECARIRALAPTAFLAIEHIGSTAVPGLAAKPVVDMVAGVAAMNGVQALVERLCANGWTTSNAFNDAMADRKWLMRWRNGHRTHHLHIVVHGSPPWRAWLAFRDALRRDPALADRYLDLKCRLAVDYRKDRDAYTAAKVDFVASVVRSELGA